MSKLDDLDNRINGLSTMAVAPFAPHTKIGAASATFGGSLLQIWNAMVDEAKALAALIYADATAAAGAVSDAFVAMLPNLMSSLKSYAIIIVKGLASNTLITGALGQWQFGEACVQLFQAIKSGYWPGLKSLAVVTIETLIQAAVASFEAFEAS
jgi:hypothetical protein